MTTSAGILLFRTADAVTEVFLAHLGGPFWARKEDAAWSIPKGEHTGSEEPLAVALREFEEEIGVPAPDIDYALLGAFRQSSGKTVTVFAAPYDGEMAWVSSNTFEVELPRGSGRMVSFPEVDRAQWFTVDDARPKLVKGQRAILDALQKRSSA